ncbi:hypothetical protein RchiOBHm_Chr3g0467921 [Rosa chinensis]|uniref:Uncharacterized protein n=1 Tax=Rosa chinensis TaxID=74649 RepID=A0A2P6RAD9_ROSCH|nr:hypothetical protein RchiOBHm_Chr3g0467921 [Rosa chinensis]
MMAHGKVSLAQELLPSPIFSATKDSELAQREEFEMSIAGSGEVEPSIS